MNPQPAIDAMRAAAQSMGSGDARDVIRAAQQVHDAMDALKASALAELEASKDFEIDGASTVNAWVRNELRLNARQASILVRNAAALRDLPLMAQAALAGKMSAAHVQVFAYGLKHIGLEPMLEFEDVFVQVALDRDPGELFEVVKHLRDHLFPEDLDEAWKSGMDKEDFQVSAVPDGWHVSGFLNTVTGAKLKKVLDSVSAPRDGEDERTGSQRRVQGLDDVLSDVLGAGRPTDKGVRPHMSVFVDADTVQAAADQAKQAAENPFGVADPMPPTEPARLAGHGAIGPNLLMYLLCVSDLTAFVMKDGGRQAQVDLDRPVVVTIGRAKRDKRLQRSCRCVRGTSAHLARSAATHHTIFWSHGGPTDLDLLVGLCTRCHHLLHRGLLNITGNAVDGFEFTNRAGGRIRRRRRTSYRPAA